MPSTRREPEAPEAVLRGFAEGLGLPVMGESSVKLVPGAALTDRYLLSVPASAITAPQAAGVEKLRVVLARGKRQVADADAPLYLLDADLPENPRELQLVTDRLYGGDVEHRAQPLRTEQRWCAPADEDGVHRHRSA